MDIPTIRMAVEAYCRQRGISCWHPKAALIDMDGTLIDSMRNHSAAWKRLSDELGLDATREEFYSYEGMTGPATIRLLFRRAKGYEPDDATCNELYKRKSGYFNELPRVQVIPGAAEMLRYFMTHGITRVLVTGSKQLSNLNRLDDDFPGAFPHELRITATDVVHGKPHPEPYLKAMAMAHVTPEESIVVENAPLGVESGRASGAFVLGVCTGPVPAAEMAASGAHLVFSSMQELADSLPSLVASPLSLFKY